jgi:hypothetical protein
MNFSLIPSNIIRKLQISHSIAYSSHNVRKIPFIFQRNATSSTSTTTIKAPKYKFRNFIVGTASIIGTIFFIEYYFDSRAAIHKYFFMPLLRNITTPESSHKFAIWIFKLGLNAKDRLPDDERLSVEVSQIGWCKLLITLY